MKHKHEKLIAIWNDDNSTKFEFAYGTGVDFVWDECDITYVIKNPSIQIRVKNAKPKKEKRWIVCSPKHNDVNETLFDYKPDMSSFGKYCKLIEIEVEV